MQKEGNPHLRFAFFILGILRFNLFHFGCFGNLFDVDFLHHETGDRLSNQHLNPESDAEVFRPMMKEPLDRIETDMTLSNPRSNDRQADRQYRDTEENIKQRFRIKAVRRFRKFSHQFAYKRFCYKVDQTQHNYPHQREDLQRLQVICLREPHFKPHNQRSDGVDRDNRYDQHVN